MTATSRIGAVILAAGFGTRLAPLTDITPKPLLEVGGRPVVDWLLARLRELDGLDEVVVIVNDQHPAQWTAWQRSVDTPIVRVISNGVTTEQGRHGAVADLAAAIAHLDTRVLDHVIVLAGDNLIDEPLQAHLDAAARSGAPVVLCRDLGSDVPPNRFGEITIDDAGHIVRFREKPDRPESPLAATCSYLLPATIGDALASYLATGDADSPGSFVGWLAAQRRVLARPLVGSDRKFNIAVLVHSGKCLPVD